MRLANTIASCRFGLTGTSFAWQPAPGLGMGEHLELLQRARGVARREDPAYEPLTRIKDARRS